MIDWTKPIEAYLGDEVWPAEVDGDQLEAPADLIRIKILAKHKVHPKDRPERWTARPWWFHKHDGHWNSGCKDTNICIRNKPQPLVDPAKPIEAYLGSMVWPARVISVDKDGTICAVIDAEHSLEPNKDWMPAGRSWNFEASDGRWSSPFDDRAYIHIRNKEEGNEEA